MSGYCLDSELVNFTKYVSNKYYQVTAKSSKNIIKFFHHFSSGDLL